MYGCLPILLFGIFFVILSVFVGIVRLLFGINRVRRQFRRSAEAGARRSGSSYDRSSSSTQSSGAAASSGADARRNAKGDKFFQSDEGEYVDFEEVK